MFFILYQQRRNPSPQRKKQLISIDDRVVTLLDIDVTTGTNTAEVSWDDIVFGRNCDIHLYIHMSYALEVAARN